MRRGQRGFVPRRLVVGALALVLVAGCTSIAGTPQAVDGPGEPPAGATGVSGGGEAPADEDHQPTSSELIAAALESGEIDEPTSLLYRTWLFFGDPQLPDEYVGEPEPYELGLISEIRSKLDGMPADIRHEIEPYLMRPSDPGSAFDASDEPPGFRGGLVDRSLMDGSGSKKPPPPCDMGWDTAVVEGLPFRIWACRNLEDAVPGSMTKAENAIAVMLSEYVPKMTADMGALIPDDPAFESDPRADERIDVYVLPTGWLGPNRQNWSKAPNYAVTIESQPEVGVTTSAYMLISSDHFDDIPLLERMVVHELFHMLQYTHNAKLASRWFYEASAEWAASYYVRSDSARLHQVRLPILQNSRYVSLESMRGLHPYGAYLWPLFMEQERGPESVFATWSALGQVPEGSGDAAVISVLDKQLDVAKNFPDFAMRVYNANDLPGDPIPKRFVSLDPHFPDGATPTKLLSWTLGEEDPLDIDFTHQAGLAFYYAPVEVPPAPGGGDHGVVVTVSGDAHTVLDGKLPELEALVEGENGDFKRETIAYHGDGQKICVKDKLILVLTNQATRANDVVAGGIRLKREKDEHGNDKRCGRVEADNPATLTKLANSGETVTVPGTENDGTPGTAPIVVTVSNLPPGDTSKYLVKITLTGGTLNGSQQLSWPLDEFTELAPGKYRKGATVSLDKDLTDANRPFTIDARLTHDGKEIDSHTPTVDLHGKKPCKLTGEGSIAEQAEAANCRLVGTLRFSFHAHLEEGPGFHNGNASWEGDLTVRLKPGKLLMDSRTTFIDDGSAWSMSGSSHYDYCVSRCVESTVVDETFSDDDPNRVFDDETLNEINEIAPRLNVWLHPPTVLHSEDEPNVRVQVPVAQDFTVSGSLVGHTPPGQYDSWVLGCFTPPEENWQSNNDIWDTDGFYKEPLDGGTDLVGKWNANHTVLDVHCDQSWSFLGSGGTAKPGGASYSATGDLHLISGP